MSANRLWIDAQEVHLTPAGLPVLQQYRQLLQDCGIETEVTADPVEDLYRLQLDHGASWFIGYEDVKQALEALAPFVLAGSLLDMDCKTDYGPQPFRWWFTGKRLVEIEPVFPEGPIEA